MHAQRDDLSINTLRDVVSTATRCDGSRLENCNKGLGEEVYVQRVGAARAGRMLDGREHLALPEGR